MRNVTSHNSNADKNTTSQVIPASEFAHLKPVSFLKSGLKPSYGCRFLLSLNTLLFVIYPIKSSVFLMLHISFLGVFPCLLKWPL